MPLLTLTHLEQTFRAVLDTPISDLAIPEQMEILLGLLVLKRASDHGAIPDDCVLQIPPRASWAFLRDELAFDIAAGLNEAALELRQANPGLAGALGAVDFASATAALGDADGALRQVIGLLDGISLRDDDLAFPGLLGRACGTLLSDVGIRLSVAPAPPACGDGVPGDGMDASLARMMARLAGVGPGRRLFDPCIGAGELLVAAREQLDWVGGDPATLELRGEGADRQSRAVAQLGLLLHGWADAAIVAAGVADVAGAGSDIVLTRLPAAAESGQDVDGALRCLHRGLAALRPGGVMVARVAGGVLTSDPAWRATCRDMIAEDLVEAAIAVPAAQANDPEPGSLVLVLRARDAEGRSGKAQERQGKVLFIDAAATGGAAGLSPALCERVLASLAAFAGVGRFAAVVASDALAASGWDLSPRRALAAVAPPERQDVRAHLIGGIPVSEVELRSPDLDAVGLDPSSLLVPATEPTQLSLFDQRPRPEVDEQYLAFRWDLVDREDLASVIEDDAGVQEQRAELATVVETWWSDHAPDFLHLAGGTSLHAWRAALVDSLVAEIAPLGILDRLEIRGAAEAWWREIEPDVRTLHARGPFSAVMASWLGAIETAAGPNPRGRDPLRHPLVLHLVPGSRAELDAPSRASRETIVRRVLHATASLDESLVRAAILAITYERLVDALDREVAFRLGSVVAQVEAWWDKYHTSLRTLEARRSDARMKLDALMREWGYV